MKLTHRELFEWLEAEEKKDPRHRVFRELYECPEFQEDLKNAQRKEEFYNCIAKAIENRVLDFVSEQTKQGAQTNISSALPSRINV